MVFSTKKISGSIVALITPMTPEGNIDYITYKRLIDWHIEEGTDALVVVGTTGESPSVSMDENAELIKVAVEYSNGRIPIISGVGANSTSEAIHLTKFAKKVGADAGLSVVPYYNKPSQDGIYQHFKNIAENVDLPIILYNVPGRTSVDMSNETVIKLTEIPGIIGIKDATGDIARGALLIRDCPSDFKIFSGDDSTAAALMMLGCSGSISVTANILPKTLKMLCDASMQGDIKKARELNSMLAPINKALFIEANPIPVKWALSELGMISLGYRLPLIPLNEKYHNLVRNAMKLAGCIF
ncbi:4-hydroxy-tetrahydrodipicolinate synthase [Candidatus Kinetoplastibacterium sorsogonicusi]|uniref:4-hydroxy-tetrahydrodipicolinate synthase n=1 Tax=Candidatus Kinetoplastidibacterium kentomonadis TaxID=1576550 RepID=A0A3S7J9F0_9PROT|nr:4-hydroxy-tetrahydrodipicolinate synthase [Candidatus Kinetoplastibacterium sorsogonicusi]AWD32289.1 4-hydroxy-tetrahydrodipicolinate synthase [Candidatus Kinetoplastibacterium sorsogonicusi]